jgi:hypothetical protein
MPQEDKSESTVFGVIVSMRVSNEQGEEVESKTVDFGKLREDQLKGLIDIFAIMASNVEYIRKLAPQYEKVGKTVPPYLR